MAFFRCQPRGMQAARVSLLPWTISILSTPLGKWPHLLLGPLCLPTTKLGLLPHLPTWSACELPGTLEPNLTDRGPLRSRYRPVCGGSGRPMDLSWPAAGCRGVGSCGQVCSWMLLRQHYGVRCDSGEVSLFLWASVFLSAKWKGLDLIGACPLELGHCL